jgi:hypothetical protein
VGGKIMILSVNKGFSKAISVLMSVILMLTAFLLLFGNSPTVHASIQATYYVSPNGNNSNPGTEALPFRTIEKARDVVSLINGNMTGDIIIKLKGGRYEISDTIVFDANNSGTNGYHIIYQNYSNEAPIIDGGIVISGWTNEGNGIYSASVPSGMTFRQLYVDGNRGIRSRQPNAGTYGAPVQSDFYQTAGVNTTNKILKINKGQISNWGNLNVSDNSVEMVILRSYIQTRLRIESYTTDASYAYVVPREYDRTDAFKFGAPFESSSYFMENAFEFLDAEGEWFLDTSQNKLFYKPRAGENLASVQVIAPKVERLLEINGASYIKFFGLSIQHSTWLDPTYTGYTQRQGGLHFHDNPNEPQLYSNSGAKVNHTNGSAVYLKNAHHIQFERNLFKHLGSNGINYDIGTHDNYVLGNVFYEMADTAIVLGMAEEDEPLPGEGNWHEIISNNYFYRMGMDYSGSMAMFATHVNGLLFEHNEIDGSPNLATNTGWGNRNYVQDSRRDIKIRYNKISNVAFLHRDSGGIHTKSNTPGGEIFENYITNMHYANINVGNSSPVAAIFLDTDTDNYRVEHNVLQNVTVQGVRMFQEGPDNISTNNNTQDQAVKDNARLEASYTDIKSYYNGGSIGGALSPSEPTPYPVPHSAFSPIAQYLFDFNAYDYTANGYNGTPLGSPSYSSTDKKEGTSSLSLDGINDYISLTSYAGNLPVGNSERTIAGWFKPSAASSQSFMSYGTDSTGRKISITADTTKVSVAVNGHDWGVSGLSLSGAWHHIAVVFPSGATSSNQFKIYLDGIEQSPSTLAGSPMTVNTGSTFAYIGRNTSGSEYYKGKLDEVLIYNKVLNQSEISQLADSTASALAEYQFENNTNDSSGHGYNGTPLGSPSYSSTDKKKGTSSISLDGINDYISLTSYAGNLPVGNSERTIAGWFKPSAASAQSFMSYGTDSTGRKISITADTTKLSVAVNGHERGVSGLSLSGAWHHIAVVFPSGATSSSQFKIYLDGIEQSLSTLAGSPMTVNTGSTFSYIGRNTSGTEYYNGKLDEVMIFNRALDNSEILLLAQ